MKHNYKVYYNRRNINQILVDDKKLTINNCDQWESW